jgi:hypothetical protein
VTVIFLQSELFRERIRLEKRRHFTTEKPMHCPSCGQQQISSETKFCSRCGLPLALVAEVVNNGGYLPQLAQLNAPDKKFFSRRNGLGFSLIWLLFFLFIMTPFGAIINVEEIAAACAVIGLFGGLIMMVISFIFLPKDSSRPASSASGMAVPNQFGAQPARSELPPQQYVPVSAYEAARPGSWRDTNDLQPNSVTESTTRLLTKEEADQ